MRLDHLLSKEHSSPFGGAEKAQFMAECVMLGAQGWNIWWWPVCAGMCLSTVGLCWSVWKECVLVCGLVVVHTIGSWRPRRQLLGDVEFSGGCWFGLSDMRSWTCCHGFVYRPYVENYTVDASIDNKMCSIFAFWGGCVVCVVVYVSLESVQRFKRRWIVFHDSFG